MKSKVHAFVNHEGEVFQVQWSPFKESVSHTGVVTVFAARTGGRVPPGRVGVAVTDAKCSL